MKTLDEILKTCVEESVETEVIDDVSYRSVYLDKVEALIKQAYAVGMAAAQPITEADALKLPLSKKVPIALRDGSVLYLERTVLSSFQALVNQLEKEIE